MNNIYPKELLVEINQGENFIVGVIQVNKTGSTFSSEIYLRQIESGKIFKFIKQLYTYDDENDLINESMQHLRRFLRNPNNL